MITALDSIKLLTADIAAAMTMERLLGRPVIAGEESATVRLDNMALDLVASEDGREGLAGLAFAIESIDQAQRICERRALNPGAPIGARLGLDMRLDRTEPKWGARLMFFRAGDLIVEVVHNLAEEPSDKPDQLWGLSWRAANIEAAHARLKASAFDVSEIRPGRKPGTRVFTVKNNTLGIPTLILQPASRDGG
ncbi:MAG: hypothetical protein ABL996_27305 [Micropepsaceae bacterium]